MLKKWSVLVVLAIIFAIVFGACGDLGSELEDFINENIPHDHVLGADGLCIICDEELHLEDFEGEDDGGGVWVNEYRFIEFTFQVDDFDENAVEYSVFNVRTQKTGYTEGGGGGPPGEIGRFSADDNGKVNISVRIYENEEYDFWIFPVDEDDAFGSVKEIYWAEISALPVVATWLAGL